jgi:uncharacterized protein YbjT (DUF2867 family)
MRVLVTGGSGVIGEGLIPHLLERGHQVRLLTRRADEAVREWPAEVESRAADVSRPEQLLGATDGCDAVVHISGIVAERPPDETFEQVNIEGTRNLLVECARAGMPTFIFISSLGADRGTSAYQVSKREAEAIVQTYAGRWLILRPGGVYGPGDEIISQLLNMHRALPAIPVIGAGDHPFQPIWYLDLGKAITRALESHLDRRVYELAGEEVVTPNEIFRRLDQLTGRTPARVPVPELLAGITTRVAETVGMPFPINEAQFQMLIEHNVVQNPDDNALTRVFGVTPTPLSKGLALLADAQPEQTPDQGVGGMEQKRFWADITGSKYSPESLMDQFRIHCTEVMPIDFAAEAGTPRHAIEGMTLTAAVARRGNIQIRVVESTSRTVTFATLRGHPLAGVVRFTASEPAQGVVRFAISVFARAANLVDWITLSTVGGAAQNSTWRTAVARMVELSGGVSSGVEEEKRTVDPDEARGLEEWIGELVSNHRRAAHERSIAQNWSAT